MRGVAVVFAFAVGCGAPPAARPPISNAPQPRDMADPHRSREALVRAAFASLAAGDLNMLVALAGDKDVYLRTMECAGRRSEREERKLERDVRRAQESVVAAGLNMKGRSIEVLAVGAPDRTRKMATAGDGEGPCTMKVDVVRESVEVKVRVEDKKHRSAERKVKVEVLAFGERYYLERVPKEISSGGMDDIAAQFEVTVDRVCACKDQACSEKVMEDYTKQAAEWAKEPYEEKETPDPELMKRFEEMTKKMTDCMVKLAPPTP